MAHALTTHLGQGHFHTTFLADYTAMLEALVLTAQTLVVFNWAKDLGAEQTVTLRFECSVVNRSLAFLTSPKDHALIISGDARPMRMESNSSDCD
jgi:hypothetical protein